MCKLYMLLGLMVLIQPLRGQAAWAMSADAPVDCNPLILQLLDRQPNVRRAAAGSLSQFVDDPADVSTPVVLALVRSLHDADDDVRAAALESLYAASNPLPKQAIVPLVETLKYCDASMREAARDILVHHQWDPTDEIVGSLTRALGSRYTVARASAADTLAIIAMNGGNIAPAVPALKKNAERGTGNVRSTAIIALGWNRTAPTKWLPIVLLARHDSNADVRYAVAFALGRIQGADEQTVPALVKMLGDQNAEVRSKAAEQLGWMYLIPVREEGNSFTDAPSKPVPLQQRVRPEARRVVAPLIHALSDGDEHVRFQAAQSLSWIAPYANDAIAALTVATKDNSAWVRYKASEALFEIDPSTASIAVPVLTRLVESEPEQASSAAMVLRHVGPPAKEAFTVLLQQWKRAQSPFDDEIMAEALKAIDLDAALAAGIK